MDYATALTLPVIPRALGWSETVTRRMDVAAVGTALYSVATRYERGWKPVALLPMGVHLLLDFLSGVTFCLSPKLLPGEDKKTLGVLTVIGLAEIVVSLSTQTIPEGEA